MHRGPSGCRSPRRGQPPPAGRFRAWTRAHLALADAGPGAWPTRARQDTGMPSAEATRPGPRPAANGLPRPGRQNAGSREPGGRPRWAGPWLSEQAAQESTQRAQNVGGGCREALQSRAQHDRIPPMRLRTYGGPCPHERTAAAGRGNTPVPLSAGPSPLSTLDVIVTLLFVAARAMSRAAPVRIVWLPSSNAAPLESTRTTVRRPPAPGLHPADRHSRRQPRRPLGTGTAAPTRNRHP